MEKLIATLSRNKNTVIAVLSLMIVSMATVFLFWDDNFTDHPQVSITHHAVGTSSHQSAGSENEPTYKWKEVVDGADQNQLIFVLNQEAEFIYIDQTALSSLGYNESELSNQKFFPFVNSTDLPEVMISMIKAMQTGKTLSNIGPYRVKVKTPEGEPEKYLHLIATIIPLKDDTGKVTELVVIHKDITSEVAPESGNINKKKIRNQDNEQKRRIVEVVAS